MKISLDKRRLLGTLCLSVTLSLYATDTFAQNQKQPSAEYSVPAQSLRGALAAFGVQADLQIVYSSNLVENIVSPGLDGTYSPEGGLQKLLENSGLDYEFIDKKSVIIIRAPAPEPPRSTPAPSPTPAATIGALDLTDRPPALEIVTVTGSRVPRSEFSTAYPSQAVGPMKIQDGAHPTIADAVNTLPVMCEPSFSLNAPGASNIGESYGDLYCLGSQRTLSLINGRRSVSSNEPAVPNSEPGLQVDLNMIPSIMVSNIEVIGVGSAPVYGSDAIGGTVNVLLRDNFDGFEMDLQGGLSDLQDGEQARLGLLFGRDFFSDRANLTTAYEYHRQEEVLARHRQYTLDNYDYVYVSPGNLGANNEGVIFASQVTNPVLTPFGIPTPSGNDFPRFATGENRFDSLIGNPLGFNQNGRLQEFNLGQRTLDLFATVGGDGLRSQDFRFLRLPAERHSLAMNANVDIGDNIRAFSELQLYRAEFSALGDSFEVVASFNPNQNNEVRRDTNPRFYSLPLSLDYPFLHPADRSFLLASDEINDLAQEFYLHKDWRSLIDPTVNVESTIARAVIGVEGNFTFLERDWHWEISANHGRSESDTQSTSLQRENFNRALTLTRNPQDGTPVCLSDTDNCVPLNVLGTRQSADALAYVTQKLTDNGELEQDIYTASMRGDVMNLHGGELGIVIGAERRREEAIYNPPENFQIPRLPISPSDLNVIRDIESGNAMEFTTSEVFTEVVAPIIGEGVIPAVEKVELEANWRGVDHSIAGDDQAWTLAARVNLNPEFIRGRLVLRANSTSSIRSPTLLELSLPFSPVASMVNDPCDTDFVNRGPNPESRRGNCIAEAANSGLAYNINDFESQIPRLAPLSLQGTATLKNEQARSTTIGAVYKASNESDLSFSVDAIKIEIEDAIALRNLQGVLDTCYDQGDERSCAEIVRISNFQLFGIQNSYQNIGSISLDAVQYTLKYRFDIPQVLRLPGELSLDLSAYQLREFLVDEDQGIEERQGLLRYPKLRWNAGLNYFWNDFSLAWTSLYTSAVDIELSFLDINERAEVDAYLYHTLALGYRINDHLSARMGIQNVFDSDPPNGLPSRETGGTYDAVGRYFSAGFTISF